MSEKIYKISVSSLYARELTDIALACGTYEEMQSLCEDMSKYQKGAIKDFYSFIEMPVQVLDENGTLFNVLPTKFSSGINIDEPKMEIVKDTEQDIQDKINAINNHSKDVFYEYEKANILTPKQVWAEFESRMKKLNINVSRNSKYSENVEREK